MTAAVEGVEWSAARPGRTLPPEKTRYPFYRRLGGPQGRSGRAEEVVIVVVVVIIIIIKLNSIPIHNVTAVQHKCQLQT